MSAKSPLLVRKVAVLGAGVMGAQIAAHLINARVPVLLFELAAKEGDPDGNVLKAIANLKKLEPSPLALKDHADLIEAANYDQHLDRLADCDIVIEAISERMDWKADLYRKVAPHLGEHTIFASNTSGLSINRLAEVFPEQQRHRFCGVHFFNPPRYMHLVELIACNGTDAGILDELERFLVTTLGKGVVRAKDTPNFIANRVGVFSMLATLHHAERLAIGFDTVDALTGPLVGRPKSATFRTADVVGLDTFAHVVHTMRDTLPDDPWHRYYGIPAWMQQLIDAGALGQKTRKGVYQKVGRDIQVLDLKTGAYRVSDGKADEAVVEILKNKNAAERFAQLHASSHPQAQFIWSIFRDSFHYCALHLESIAHNARDLDFAIRWGFGWDSGPFEIWQSAGWPQIARWIADDIAAGKTMAAAPLPAWVTDSSRSGVHTAAGSWSPVTQDYQPRSKLPVYRRQPFPDRLLGEARSYGTTIFETEGVRCWHTGDDIAIVSFKSRMHAIGDDVLQGVQQAIDEAERNYAGLVIWQTEPPFSVGANLKKTSGSGSKAPPAPPSALGKLFKNFKREAESLALRAARQLGVADQLMAGKLAEVEHLVEQFQATTQMLKYSMVPTVAAVDGLALGGGCEFIMHCDRAVATLESYIGLVEVGVGLLPAGGGCKEFAMRAAAEAKGGDIAPFLQKYFKAVAMAEVGRSAEHARELGYLRATDRVVMNRFELLEIAKAEARALAAAGYRPPLRARAIPVLGRSGISTIRAFVENMHAGGHISDHDRLIATRVATVMCGGDIEGGSLVDEQWLLDLERRHFMELIATEKSQARIEHMLKTGKPLRN
ncbi:MAG: 3-hydroxyacyl-CoA dehydrogenase/enoyl-CoA hydratase family protein [Burkholderiales bacterium]|jgi:3-hydroxyacyl-CoA dehydrogenase|nr:3-hydroxyacyl-CoA dehydrogenase/enoyl-CoA hydratase family protein [Burkholderiales bacterium]